MPFSSDYAPVDIPSDPFSDLLLSAIWKHSLATPDKPAFINAEDETDRLTWSELYLRIRSIAIFLEQRAFGHGDVACLVLPNCWEFVAIFGGVALRGGVTSGASYIFTEYELERQFVDSNSKVVFCAEDGLSTVMKAVKRCKSVKFVVVIAKTGVGVPSGTIHFDQVIATEPNVQLPRVPINVNEDLLLLPYSSGTTGPPKGVMLTHRNFTSNLIVCIKHYETEMMRVDRNFRWQTENFLNFLPFYHIYGFGMVICTVFAGSTMVFMKKFESTVFCRNIQRHRIRVMNLVPPILVFLSKSPVVGQYDLSSLRLILSGAAPAGAELCVAVKNRLPNVVEIGQGFGMSELSMASHMPTMDKPRYEATGKLLPNLEQKIVDPETQEEVPRGQSGELCIRGPIVMKGYLNRPKDSANTIDREGWLRTGDIGFLDDEGYLHIVDRLKELIKVNGLQVPPAELEDLLLSHPDVSDCAVIGIPDARAGEVPKAFVVTSNDKLTQRSVADYVKERVAHYKQLKGGVEFIDEIPKSPAGKILRRILKNREGERLKKSKI